MYLSLRTNVVTPGIAQDEISGGGSNPAVAGNSPNNSPVNSASGAITRSNRLVDLIADQIASKGAASPEVSDLVSVSNGACAAYAEKVKKGMKVSGWANDYLASACQGFDASQFKGLKDPAPDFFSISIEGGQAAATDAALDYLRHPDSVFAALQAGMVVKEGGKLPNQDALGLSDEQFARALAAANASMICPGQHGCAAAQVLVAATCADTSCPTGTTYESALRRNLSPAELEASERLSEWLTSIRK